LPGRSLDVPMASSSGITKNDFYLGIGLFWFLGFAVMLIVLIAFGPMLGCDLGLKACP